jgi:hypothetical protein
MAWERIGLEGVGDWAVPTAVKAKPKSPIKITAWTSYLRTPDLPEQIDIVQSLSRTGTWGRTSEANRTQLF